MKHVITIPTSIDELMTVLTDFIAMSRVLIELAQYRTSAARALQSAVRLIASVIRGMTA